MSALVSSDYYTAVSMQLNVFILALLFLCFTFLF